MISNGVIKQGMSTDIKKLYSNLYNIDHALNNKNNFLKGSEFNVYAVIAYNMAIKMLFSNNSDSDYIQYESNGYLLTANANHNYGLPFGTIPKFLLSIIINEIKFTKSPVLRFGKIYTNLRHISQLQYSVDGINKNHYLYDQMIRMFSSNITFSFQHENKDNKFDFWWNPLKGRKENVSSSSTIVMTKELFIGLLHSKNNTISNLI